MKLIKNYIEGFINGDKITRLSYFVMGSGSFLRKQYVRGFTYLGIQLMGIIYFAVSGFQRIVGLTTLGTVSAGRVWDEARGIYINSKGDNSMLFLLFGVVAVVILLGLTLLYFLNIKNAIENQKSIENGEALPTFKDDLKDLFDRKYHITVLSIPTILTITFTVLPLIFMILIAFTNFDKNHQPPGHLFTWVGL